MPITSAAHGRRAKRRSRFSVVVGGTGITRIREMRAAQLVETHHLESAHSGIKLSKSNSQSFREYRKTSEQRR